ncbi:CotO family spore coat protein [Jeotgalibacillus sp. S-D1]|uniref:CotO family spore coat protein n=1 Tax=Jeotgalibacillus sp. S-D1 TaxID=2552189 RepID=UPI001404B5C5|nr:CotO family spore coat protein [Jeotgalibacillus sp. S-D1]
MKNKDENKRSHNPLLYINQPKFDCAKPSMQQVYQTTRSKEADSDAKIKKPASKKKFSVEPLGHVKKEKNHTAHKEEPEEEMEIQEETAPKHDMKKPRFQQLKPFKDMDVEERLDYLKPFIGKKAPFMCMFVFSDKTHVRGVLESCDEEELCITVKEGEIVTRKKEELLNIFIS